MKKFCLKLFAFIVIMGILLAGILLLSAHEPFRSALMTVANAEDYGEETTGEIMPFVETVSSPSEYKKLIIGDSVCRQLFNPFQKYNNVYCTVGSNQAITMIGQYLLIKEFLENHEQTTDVYLVLCSIEGSGLDHGVYTYQYLVAPFTEAGLLEDVLPKTKGELDEKFGKLFMEPDVIQFIDASPLAKKLFLNSLNNKDYDNTTMSFEYLQLIHDLCMERGAKLHLLHNPMKESSYEDIQVQKENDLSACKNEDMRAYIEEYYGSVTSYSDEYFADGIHFGPEYKSEEQLAGYIRGMIEKTDGLSDFVLE